MRQFLRLSCCTFIALNVLFMIGDHGWWRVGDFTAIAFGLFLISDREVA